jgi:predicted metallo-beta-lactamase superfamily hydrolase
MLIQLDLFEDKNETDILRDQITIVKESNDKVRKSLFARHGELAKKYIEIHQRLEILERNICRG